MAASAGPSRQAGGQQQMIAIDVPPDAVVEVQTSRDAAPKQSRAAHFKLQCGAGLLYCKDALLQELYMTGEQVWGFLTPAQPHHLYFTTTALLVFLVTFFAMATDYASYQALTSSPSTLECMKDQQLGGSRPYYGPASLLRWLAPRAGKSSPWCYNSAVGEFDTLFLIHWGARWAPSLRASPVRWLTSSLLHVNFAHLLSNCLLFLGLSSQLEREHGAYRIGPAWVASALGGNLLSAVVEDECTAVAGASGGIFGLLGVFVAETFLSHRRVVRRRFMRVAMTLCFVILFIVVLSTDGAGTSTYSHLGGFLFGMLTALVLLPSTLDMPWRVWLCVAGATAAAACATGLATYFYLRILPYVCCDCR